MTFTCEDCGEVKTAYCGTCDECTVVANGIGSAQLEALCERWESEAKALYNYDGEDLVQGALDACAAELRRVLDGASVPAVGEEWRNG